MYRSKHYTVTDKRILKSFVHQFPLGNIIIPVQDDFPETTSIPLLLTENDDALELKGHIMKGSSHFEALKNGQKVLVIFNGPSGYISATSYPEPQRASTWNYMNVYVKGVLSISGKEGALENIRALTDRFENQDSESAYNKIPESYIQQLINEITGINITVQSIEGVFKLSQDKTLTTRKQIIEDLKKRNTAFDLMLAQYIEAN